MDRPQIWGPVLWSVLHTSAEHLGKPQPSIIQKDEVVKWILLLKSVEFILPCSVCKMHYHEWILKHPIIQFDTLCGMELRERARLWLYKLHENVNGDKGVESGIALEDIPGRYGSLVTYKENVEKLLGLLKANIQTGKLKAEATWAFRSNLQYLRKLSGSI